MSTEQWKLDNADKVREYKRTHYHKNKAAYMERSVRKRLELKEIADERKRVPCMDCGVQYKTYIMEFDHRDPAEKEGEISRLVTQGNLKKLLAEMDKCDVVCANCHRERTHGTE